VQVLRSTPETDIDVAIRPDAQIRYLCAFLFWFLGIGRKWFA